MWSPWKQDNMERGDWIKFFLVGMIICTAASHFLVTLGAGTVINWTFVIAFWLFWWINPKGKIAWFRNKWYGKLDKNGIRVKHMTKKVKKKTEDIISL